MRFKLLKDCTEIVSTSDERFFFNNSADEVAVLKSDLSASHLLEKLDEVEGIIRSGIVDTLSKPLSEVLKDPINRMGSRNDQRTIPDELIGRIGTPSSSGQTNAFKYLYLRGLDGPYRDYLIKAGKWPLFTSQGKKRYPKRLREDRHGTTANQIINGLSSKEFRTMMQDIIIDAKVPLTSKSVRLLEIDFEGLRDRIRTLSNGGTELLLKELSNLDTEILPPLAVRQSGKERGLTPIAKAWMYLLFYGAQTLWKLPARVFEGSANTTWAFARIPRFTGQIAHVFLPKEKHAELRGVMHSIGMLYKAENARDIQIKEIYLIFACSNYETSEKFDFEGLDLVRACIADWLPHHNIVPYIRGCIDHYEIDGRERDKIEARISVRAGARAQSVDPFIIYRMPYNEARNLLKAQVSTFERHTGCPFPDQFPPYLEQWICGLEELIATIPNISFRNYIVSAHHWLRFLWLLGPDAPQTWHDVERSRHIHNNDSTIFTLKAHLEKNDINFKALAVLEKLWLLWESKNQTGKACPFQSKIDWKAPEKRGRTYRRSIPDLIVEVLIEENARETKDGEPYAFIRECLLSDRSGNSIEHETRVRGDIKTAQYPLQAAIIDCILHLGMRSSSARWLDSGQGDGKAVDIDKVEYVENPVNPDSKERNGALQIMQIGLDQKVLSLLMLKNKTTDFHEIPYLPEGLARRLDYIRKLQEEFNPISEPIQAIDRKDKNKFSKEVITAKAYPLFRDPAYSDNLPISTDKLHRYWRRLLKHCEPIVHAKRKKIFGENTSFYPFFDVNDNPVWDIHSIRVAVVTSLLEQGVPPTIVQLLVGHKSPVMTLYYEAIDNAKTHQAIATALEGRRRAAANAIASATSEEEVNEKMSTLLGGVITPKSNEVGAEASEDLNDLISDNLTKFGRLQNVPSGFNVFAHGICPGGNCSQGGKRKGRTFTPVHRDKACSRCRFRLTGPAFLAGLALNANILISEISASAEKERNLNREILEHEDADMPTTILETRVNQEIAFRDELWADWAAEVATIQECITKTNKSGEGSRTLPVECANIGFSFTEKHHLSMLHTICKNSKIILGSSMDVPAGLKERRNSMLFDIVANNNTEAYLVRLGKKEREKAFEALGDMIDELENNTPEGADFVEKLLKGEEKLPPSLLPSPTQRRPDLEVVND